MQRQIQLRLRRWYFIINLGVPRSIFKSVPLIRRHLLRYWWHWNWYNSWARRRRWWWHMYRNRCEIVEAGTGTTRVQGGGGCTGAAAGFEALHYCCLLASVKPHDSVLSGTAWPASCVDNTSVGVNMNYGVNITGEPKCIVVSARLVLSFNYNKNTLKTLLLVTT